MTQRAPLRAMADSMFVLGNGPSLKGADLNRFSDVATIGMNAAYRYWDQIDWYPTHYCCLDREMIGSHHREIRRLVDEGLVESAFLTAEFLEHHPDAVGDRRFVFLDSFRGAWFERRGRALGLPRLHHPAFESSQPSKLTTGAYALRYGIYLGARRLFLLGIDCNYVEMVPGAKRLEGHALEMADSPRQNPNYFFDDYQQRGDRYNVPNPDIHGGNLHLQSLEVVRDDVILNELGVEIINCARKSLLNSEGVVPYRSLDDALGDVGIGAVFAPATPGEIDDIAANLQAWNEPASAPVIGKDLFKPIPYVVVLNGSQDEAIESRLRSTFEQCGRLKSAFSRIDFLYCDLEGERDIYERDYTQPVGDHGYKAGPNHQFFASMNLMAPYGRYVFSMESDCFPLRPGWLTELDRAVRGAEPFWVMGSIYRGTDTVDVRYRRHINGNAIYAAGDPAFREFLDEVWRPALDEHLDDVKTLAYDCVLPLYFHDSGPEHEPDRWRMLQSMSARFRYTDLIANISGKTDIEAGPGDASLLRDSIPHAVVVHGRHFRPSPTLDAAVERTSRKKRFEAVLVHQMGKVGSTTVQKALDDRSEWPVYHTHVLHPDAPYFQGDEVPIPEHHLKVPPHVFRSIEVRREYLDKGRRVAVVTLVREPIARNVSAFFQNIHGYLAGTDVSLDDPVGLYDLFLREFPHTEPDRWMESELNETFGVDVFDASLAGGGWAEVESERCSVLVLRTSLDDSIKVEVIARFLGIEEFEMVRANVTDEKSDTGAYDEVKRLVGANESYIDEMLSLKVAQHFFTNEERSSIRAYWAGVGSGMSIG